MAEVKYQVFDVFTGTALAGNQLGVVPDATGLSDERMQAIARELNLAETIFFFPPDDKAHSAKVRIFMPLGELPFAGHPTIGGAIAYAGWHGLPHGARVILEEGVGPVHCTVFANQSGGKSSFIAARIPTELTFGTPHEGIAAAVNLAPGDIGFDRHLVSMTSGGVPYVNVPVKDLRALSRARVYVDAWLKLDVRREDKICGAYVYCRDGEGRFRVRMFAPWDGIPEDPATGSAAVAFAATLRAFEVTADGEYAYQISQGIEMGRPSEIGLAFAVRDGTLRDITISGNAVKFAEGTLFLPD